jgi:hypothetical protein
VHRRDFRALRACDERGLSLSRHGHVAFREGRCFQVFMFSEKEHAKILRAGVRRRAMYPSGKGKGAVGAVEEGDE